MIEVHTDNLPGLLFPPPFRKNIRIYYDILWKIVCGSSSLFGWFLAVWVLWLGVHLWKPFLGISF